MAPQTHPAMHDNRDVVDTVDEADATATTALNGNMAAANTVDPAEVSKLAADMQQRCRLFLGELEQFQAYLKDKKNENQVELRTFKAGLQTELKTIDKVSIGYHLP